VESSRTGRTRFDLPLSVSRRHPGRRRQTRRSLRRALGGRPRGCTLKEKTRRTLGVSFRSLMSGLSKTLLGWRSYYGFSEVPTPLEELEKWIRRRLRCYL
jgi:hypothetical protein